MAPKSARVVVHVDVKKRPWEQELPLHNRWHPEIPSVADVTTGEVFRVEMVDWTGGQIGDNDSAEDVKSVDLSVVSPSITEEFDVFLKFRSSWKFISYWLREFLIYWSSRTAWVAQSACWMLMGRPPSREISLQWRSAILVLFPGTNGVSRRLSTEKTAEVSLLTIFLTRPRLYGTLKEFTHLPLRYPVCFFDWFFLIERLSSWTIVNPRRSSISGNHSPWDSRNCTFSGAP